MALEHPLRGPVGDDPGPLVALQGVEDSVVRQVEEDDVVEVPAVRHVVPAEELHPELLFPLVDAPTEDGLHEELEERVAPAANVEERGMHGHVRADLLQCRVRGGGYSRTPPRSLGSPAGSAAAASMAEPWSSSSPTVFVLDASGRRRSWRAARRSAATRRSRKMIVWPEIRSRPIVAKSSPALTAGGHSHIALSGVRTIRTASTTSWNRKHPRPGPRAASSG